MAENLPTCVNFPTYFIIVLIFITRLKSAISKSKSSYNLPTINTMIKQITNIHNLRYDSESLKSASTDFGKIINRIPAGVLYPSSSTDITNLISFCFNYSKKNGTIPFHIAARGNGHSIRGQAMAESGVVVEMKGLKKITNINDIINSNRNGGSDHVVMGNSSTGFYGDFSGGELWISVLKATLRYGYAPVSWTDYLYITVGGTLSNAGISGQTFRYGPQINNVLEMDVITGKGEMVSCSRKINSELFYGVLGGLGQFGIISRARISLEPAPKRVKWVRMLYSNFTAFSKDQEHLISINGSSNGNNRLNYLEGSLLMHHGTPENWRSSYFPTSDHSRIISLLSQHGIIYCLEVAKYYDDFNQTIIGKELQNLVKGLDYIPGFKFEKDVSFFEFLNRVRGGELKLQSQGQWEVPHPWLNLFVPKSRIFEFNSGVFQNIVRRRNITVGPVLIYPMNRNKWDERMSAVIPDEDVFYTVGFLHSSGFDGWETIDDQNREILQFCNNSGIETMQYLPHYKSQEDWMNHFGSKWRSFLERKLQFDPKFILSPGQRIFNH